MCLTELISKVIAVAMVGTGAGIGFYCINRESLKSKLEAEGLLVHGAADASSLLSAEVDDVDPTRKSVDKKGMRLSLFTFILVPK